MLKDLLLPFGGGAILNELALVGGGAILKAE